MNGLTQAIVWNTRAQSGADIRMTAQQVIELERRNLVAAARDDLFGAPNEFKPAIRSKAGEVAGPEEPLGERGFGQRLVIEVAEHAKGRSDLKFARSFLWGGPAVFC